jgi:hypothetical protein
MEGTQVKLLYAIAFVLFPLAAPAQTLDSSLLTALCHDDYFEDAAGRCSSISANEGLTVEAILEKYGAIIARGTEEESAIFYLTDPEDVPVGSIQSGHESPGDEYAILRDDYSRADATIEQSTITAQIITTESPIEKLDEAVFDADEVETTGPTAAHTPASTTGTVEDNQTIE